jgi:hypothetical protein
MPLFWCLWFESTIFAASRRIFFGSHPRKAHVPPNGSESIIATRHPLERHSAAAVEPAVPVPITIKSNAVSLLNHYLFSITTKRISLNRC